MLEKVRPTALLASVATSLRRNLTRSQGKQSMTAKHVEAKFTEELTRARSSSRGEGQRTFEVNLD